MKLRDTVASLTGAKHCDIIVNAIEEGCVIVTFMIRSFLITTLRSCYTEEQLNLTQQKISEKSLKYKIIKVVIQDEVIYTSSIFLFCLFFFLLMQILN